jgi:hypothetical protein
VIFTPALITPDGRSLGQLPGDGLLFNLTTTSRKVYVPPAGGFTRILDSVTNPNNFAVTPHIRISGGNQSTRIFIAPASTANTYSVADSVACCSPVLGYVFAGPGASVPVSSTQFVTGNDNLFYEWTVTIQPGQTVTFMHFVIQRDLGDTTGTSAQAQALVNLTDSNALTDMTSAEKALVVNFSIP